MPALAPVAGTKSYDVVGQRRVVSVQLPAVSDADTFAVGDLPEGVAWAEVNFEDDATVAADSIAVASVTGNVITFQVAGTARKARVVAYGLGPTNR